MADKRIYLKQWRKFAHKTQAQVVAALEGMDDPNLPTTEASLSRLENGKQPYSERVLLALAEIYGCEPWELIGRDPTKEGQVIDMVRHLDEIEQARVIAYIEGMRAGNGTDG
ncbi:helix-turn-helix domain-containing protein [Novosphingobium sp. MBES04]|uniref:helix-turn-helix domain-containing protein n=1 Tax=Novosphingobium sp. MBES04 TaxID=1206458 RepID=UPI00131F2B41|nr:helix-turn-helix transcriptional regulator [Novosphingobium sp. MBES04]